MPPLAAERDIEDEEKPMKRIMYLTAVTLLSSAAFAFPAAAQEQPAESGGAPVLKTPEAQTQGQPTPKTDRVTKDGTQQQKMPAQPGADAPDAAQSEQPAKQPDAPAAAQNKTNTDAPDAAQSQQPDAPAAAESQTGSGDAGTTTKPKTAEDADPAKKQDNADTMQQQEDDAASSQEPGVSKETTASVNINTEQQTEIRNVIVERSTKPADIDVDVSIGTAVPRTVVLEPLPPRVIEIVPQYQGYQYFVLADGRIIIVDPNSFEVVYVLSA
jgi:hypothetical protein